jgi:sulfide:quinone oxidoreductase
MSSRCPGSKFRVAIAGGGVAALETAPALADLAPDLADITLIAPNDQFVYRPMTVREPFGYAKANSYELAPIVHDAGATLIEDELARVDAVGRALYTRSERSLEYDALVLALGARATAHYAHAVTIEDRHLDELLHGIIHDVEAGRIGSLAFVAPPRMAWPLPLYELALMTAGRAYDMGVKLATTIATPEDNPLAIFGLGASSAVAELLERAGVQTMSSAYCEVPRTGALVIHPGERHLDVDRMIALPELYGPGVHGIPLGDHGFIPTDVHGGVLGVEHVYAAGTEFPVKHGGIASQQADAVAESIAARAGAAVKPEPFHPIIRGILLSDAEPCYLSAHITGGHGFASELSDAPSWAPPSKIAAKYLGPYLAERDQEATSRGRMQSEPKAPGRR